MSSRHVATSALLGLGACGLYIGCGDDPSPPAADAGAQDAGRPDATRSARPPEDVPGPSPSRASCIEACSTLYPDGKIKDDAIGACWMAECRAPCTSTPDDPDAGSDDVDGGPRCENPVTTGVPSCDLCTQARCCAAWDGCFGDVACARFTACVQECPVD